MIESTSGTMPKQSTGRLFQRPGFTRYGRALLQMRQLEPKANIDRAWETKLTNGKYAYTGNVKLIYKGKEYVRTKQELYQYVVKSLNGLAI